MTRSPRPGRNKFPDLTREGLPIGKSQANIQHGLNRLGIELSFNAFSHRVIVQKAGNSALLDEASLMDIFFQLDKLGLKAPKEWFIDCIKFVARKNTFNPVLDGVNALKWDGVERLDGWLVRHAGGDDTPFARAAFKLTLIAAVRRVRSPGTKFDQIIVLEGAQGCGKSTFVRILAGGAEHFTDALRLGSKEKETIEITEGKLIVELGELRDASKRDLSAIKHFASRQADRARLSYDAIASEVPRQFTIWGTTNDSEYLADPTGNRRFWPVTVGTIDLAQARADRDQLWAEAAYMEATNHSIVLPEDLWAQAAEAQRQRVSIEAWEEPVRELLAEYADQSVWLTAFDMLVALQVPVSRQDKSAEMRVTKCLRALGFQRITISKENRKAWLLGERNSAVRLRGKSGNLVVEKCRGA